MNDQEIRDTLRTALSDWEAAAQQERDAANEKARRRAEQVGKEKITGVTIAQNGTVSYEGIRDGNRFTCTTYQTRLRFDWGSLPGYVPVLDLDGGDISIIWNTLICKDHPSFACKASACRRVGLRVTDVRQMRKNCERPAKPFKHTSMDTAYWAGAE